MGQDRAEHPLILPLLLLAAGGATPPPSLGEAMKAIGACPRGKEGEIVVCRRSPSDRYRIPEALRPNGFDFGQKGVDSVSRERHRLMDAGASGIGSCSAIGPGGWTGCLVREFRAWEQQRAGH